MSIIVTVGDCSHWLPASINDEDQTSVFIAGKAAAREHSM